VTTGDSGLLLWLQGASGGLGYQRRRGPISGGVLVGGRGGEGAMGKGERGKGGGNYIRRGILIGVGQYHCGGSTALVEEHYHYTRDP